jgi:hypothetical protein
MFRTLHDFVVVGMARCAVRRRVQRRNELMESFRKLPSFRPLYAGGDAAARHTYLDGFA